MLRYFKPRAMWSLHYKSLTHRECRGRVHAERLRAGTVKDARPGENVRCYYQQIAVEVGLQRWLPFGEQAPLVPKSQWKQLIAQDTYWSWRTFINYHYHSHGFPKDHFFRVHFPCVSLGSPLSLSNISSCNFLPFGGNISPWGPWDQSALWHDIHET